MLLSNLLLASVASAAAIDLAPRYANMSGGDTTLQVIFPPARKAIKDSTFRAPCGGTSPGARVDYPLSGGKISVAQSDPIDNLNFLWTGPVSGKYEFKTYGEPTVVDIEAGHYCANGPDFAALGFKAGDDATLLITYQADGPPKKGINKRWAYICADVKLVDSASFTKSNEDIMCAQITSDIRKGNATNGDIMDFTISSDPKENERGSSAGSKLSLADAGGIGAGVTAGVFLLLAGALYAMGRLSFGKKKRVTLDDASSTTSGVPTKQVQH